MISNHDLVLHVGMLRASSILEPALRRLRPQLRAHGVAFLGGTQLEHLPHAAGWRRDRLAVRSHAGSFQRELASLVAAEQQRSGGLWRRRVPVVIVGDQLLGRGEIGRRDAEQLRPFAATAVSHVVQALSARSVKIIVHTQRQDRLLEFAYLRWLRAGQHARIERFFPSIFEAVLDYGDLLTRLRSVPHVSDVVVRPVELADAGLHAFVNDVLGSVGLRDVLDLYMLGSDLPVHPLVYSTQGAVLAQALNPIVQGEEFTLLQTYFTERYSAPAEYGPPDVFDLATRRRMLQIYGQRNRQLFGQHMPDLPIDSYADDVATFALGNVLRQPPSRDHTVASRITVAAAVRTNRASTALARTVRNLRRKIPAERR